jgi:RNA polymerase sigma-70 factor (ECF subfamily)
MEHVNATTWAERRGFRAEPMSFEEAAEAYLDDVYAYLLYLTGDRDAAEDLAADTFEKALRIWRRFDPRRGSARTWLCQIARTTALDHFRAERRRRRREDSYAFRELPEQGCGFGEGLSPLLEAALGELSAAEREVIALRVLLDLDGEAAARILGISPTACSTRLHRALRKLEEKVSAHVYA